MFTGDVKDLKEKGDQLFERKKAIDSRNQDIAENFYVERANFTNTFMPGDEYASHLMTSYPVLVRRQLGDAVGAMLRPKGKQWFHMRAGYDDSKISFDAKRWTEWGTQLMRRAMYDRKALLARATKEGDHDFATFGGCVISVDVNRRDNTLLYRNWHLKDVAWEEDSFGQLCAIHRNWCLTLKELRTYFGDKIHPNHERRLKQSGGESQEVTVRHIMIRSNDYDWKRSRHPWVSLFLDCENQHVLEQTGSWTRKYVLPRWQTVSGSQYALSPATTVALPDARLLQSMTLTLLDAGERAVSPPMIGVAEAIRGDMQLYAGGFTSVDAEYDERLGEVLRPISQDKNGIPFGLEMADRIAGQLREALFLNTLSMPPVSSTEMTAYEVGQRVEEYIRQAIPLFEPMEEDYNGELCEITFETLLHEGAFGPADSIPPEIQGEEVTWGFESPLSESIERNKGQKFLESKALLAEAVAVDPSAVHVLNFQQALRDALEGIGAPMTWQRNPKESEARAQQEKEMAQGQQLLESMETGANVVDKLSGASQQFAA